MYPLVADLTHTIHERKPPFNAAALPKDRERIGALEHEVRQLKREVRELKAQVAQLEAERTSDASNTGTNTEN